MATDNNQAVFYDFHLEERATAPAIRDAQKALLDAIPTSCVIVASVSKVDASPAMATRGRRHFLTRKSYRSKAWPS